jgi:hypothetical protein
MIVIHSFSVIVVVAIGYSIVFIIVAVRANQESFLLRNPVLIDSAKAAAFFRR